MLESHAGLNWNNFIFFVETITCFFQSQDSKKKTSEKWFGIVKNHIHKVSNNFINSIYSTETKMLESKVKLYQLSGLS